MLHEQKTRKEKIGKKAIAYLAKGDYTNALFSYRGSYPKSIFSEIKEWRKAKLTLEDVRQLDHVDCWLTDLSKGTMKINDVAETIMNDRSVIEKDKNPELWPHVKDILDRLEELAKDDTPVIIGKDNRSPNIRIYDGAHRLIALLIYCKQKKLTHFDRDAYYGSI